ncbi:MAG: hypothetical protein JXL20_04910 [Deltaproteobacteria bacterium]|nr:hypothetical protein [Deltaproteobacteria bacterium]
MIRILHETASNGIRRPVCNRADPFRPAGPEKRPEMEPVAASIPFGMQGL